MLRYLILLNTLVVSLFSHNIFSKSKYSWLNEEFVLGDLIKQYKTHINEYYVDIGAGDGESMSNTARLALNGWNGIGFEGSLKKVTLFNYKYEDLKPKCFQSFITPENVNELFRENDVPKTFGVLNLDIDGYDYFVLDALLQEYSPVIIISEINEKIPPPIKFTVLYDESYQWGCNDFFGMSLEKLNEICAKHGYVIAHLECNNAFLVKKELFNGEIKSVRQIYNEGYVNIENRTLYFPWNAHIDYWINSDPNECVDYINDYFSRYHGKYSIEIDSE